MSRQTNRNRGTCGGRSAIFSAMAVLHLPTSLRWNYFDDKIDSVRSATAGADPPTYAPVPVGCELRVFTPVSPADVIALVKSLPDK